MKYVEGHEFSLNVLDKGWSGGGCTFKFMNWVELRTYVCFLYKFRLNILIWENLPRLYIYNYKVHVEVLL